MRFAERAKADGTTAEMRDRGTESTPGAGTAGPVLRLDLSHAASGKLEDRRGPVFPSAAKGDRDGAGIGEQYVVGRACV